MPWHSWSKLLSLAAARDFYRNGDLQNNLFSHVYCIFSNTPHTHTHTHMHSHTHIAHTHIEREVCTHIHCTHTHTHTPLTGRKLVGGLSPTTRDYIWADRERGGGGANTHTHTNGKHGTKSLVKYQEFPFWMPM